MGRFFANKTVVIFSPQHWSHLYISKHHYARILAKDNQVYFISPPDFGGRIEANWTHPDPASPGLHVLSFKMAVPERIKFHLPVLYRAIVIRRLQRLISKTIGEPDILIDFGCNAEFSSLKYFKGTTKIYFPVDDKDFIDGDMRGADLVLSVSKNILAKFETDGKPAFFINHGLAPEFERLAKDVLDFPPYIAPPRVIIAYAGNLFSPFVDIPVFKAIIKQHPGVRFDIYGNTRYNPKSQVEKDWFDFLQSAPNVQLKGVLSSTDLAAAYEHVDGFLLCYKPDYVNYHAENSHKLLEYLGAGKVLISTNVSLYDQNPLICMSPKDRNEELVSIFSNVIEQISDFNKVDLQKARAAFALDNTYSKQLERIEQYLMELPAFQNHKEELN